MKSNWQPLLSMPALALWLVGVAASAQDSVKLTLRVLDADTGQPIANYRAQTQRPGVVPTTETEKEPSEVTGDVRGETVLEFSGGSPTNYTRYVTIEHPEYVPQLISWAKWSKTDNEMVFPSEHTTKLERGVPIGGVVRDESGQPLAGVKVYLLGSGIPAGIQTAPAWPSSNSFTNRDKNVFVETDAQGRWHYGRFPKSYPGRFRLAVQRPGGAYTEFETQPPAFDFGPRVAVISVTDLLAQKAEMSVPIGHTVSGVIVDSAGKPLAGVMLDETQGRSPTAVGRVITGTDGRFNLPNRPAKEISLAAHAEGFATTVTNVFPSPELPDVRLTLQLKRPLLARVVDETGAPMAGVTFSHYRPGSYVQLRSDGTTTDADGRFRWEDAPVGPQTFYIRSTNNVRRRITLDASEPERVVTLRRVEATFIRLTGTVIAADTKMPVPKFTVSSAEAGPAGSFNFSGEGSDGRLDLQLPRSAWRENFARVGSLQVQAEGFEPLLLPQLDFDDGDREFKFELKLGTELAGVVLQPDGQPAQGARVELNRSFRTTLNRPGEMQQPDQKSRRTTTGADGKFSFPADVRNRHLVFTHETGFAALTPGDVAASGEVRLEPWGRLTGVAMESGKPAAGVTVSLNSPSRLISWKPGDPPPSRGQMFGVLYSTTTDDAGRFVFEKVPAGDFILNRRFMLRQMGPIYFSHPQPVTARSGQTVEVTYGGKGRTVTGWAQSDPPGLAVDWQWDRQVLTLQVTGQLVAPSFYDFADTSSYTAARSRYDAALRAGAKPSDPSQYQLQFDADGHFHVADVPPGNYELALRLTEPQQGRQMFLSNRGKELGSTLMKVVVPDGPLKEVVDIGTVPVRITGGNLGAAPVLPPFEALTLDGKPLRIADLRGRHVVLVFWAAWCRSTAEALADLQAAYEAFKDHPRVAMIGVSLDESTDAAKAFAEARKLPWATGWLDDAGRARLVDVYGVKGTPTVFLIDPQGNITAREVRPEGLRAMLEKTVK